VSEQVSGAEVPLRFSSLVLQPTRNENSLCLFLASLLVPLPCLQDGCILRFSAYAIASLITVSSVRELGIRDPKSNPLMRSLF